MPNEAFGIFEADLIKCDASRPIVTDDNNKIIHNCDCLEKKFNEIGATQIFNASSEMYNMAENYMMDNPKCMTAMKEPISCRILSHFLTTADTRSGSSRCVQYIVDAMSSVQLLINRRPHLLWIAVKRSFRNNYPEGPQKNKSNETTTVLTPEKK